MPFSYSYLEGVHERDGHRAHSRDSFSSSLNAVATHLAADIKQSRLFSYLTARPCRGRSRADSDTSQAPCGPRRVPSNSRPPPPGTSLPAAAAQRAATAAPDRSPLRKNGLFWSFSHVYPEPVLVKCSFLNMNGSKRPFLLTH